MVTKLIARVTLAILTAFLFCEIVFLKKIEAEESSLPGNVQTKTVVTGLMNIDRIYKTMIGPMDTATFQIRNQPEGELIWLTGAKIETLDKLNNRLSDGYLCHSNLDVTPQTRIPHQHDHYMPASNFMDLVQGQPAIEFPRGFAIPLMTNDWIIFHAMALNSQPVQEPFDIRFKAIFNYVYDHDLERPIKALGMRFSNVFVPAPHPNCPPPMVEKAKYECGVYRADESGKGVNLHWLVPPGRHTYRYSPNEGLNIPFDTTAHFIAMHLHAYAESMELVDLTTRKTIFKGKVKYLPNNQDIDKFESFSSKKGIPIYVDHDYEIITVYNNTTNEDIDAMAVLYVYYWDKKFDKNNNRNMKEEGHF